MTRRWTILTLLLLAALPAVLFGSRLKDKVYLQTASVGKVEFSHSTHMEVASIGKNCPACHNDVYHIVTRKNPAFTMADMAAGQACGFCHDGIQRGRGLRGLSRDVTEGCIRREISIFLGQISFPRTERTVGS